MIADRIVAGMPCKICGNEATIRCHLMPRALMHDIRGGSPHLVQGDLYKRGEQKSQSGAWDDDLLCDKHEKALQESDRYAVQWIRRFEMERAVAADGDFFFMINKRPDLLQKFVCSVVWRHALSSQSSNFDMDIGPWEVRLRELIFGQSAYDPVFAICTRRWLNQSEHMKDVAFPPHKNPEYGRRGWEFEIGGLVWILILDNRRESKSLRALAANDKNPVMILNLSDEELVDRPGVIDIAVNMLSRRK
jgi:hypothetical protein